MMIGRKLVMDFGPTIVAIEIYPKSVSPYQVPETGMLFDLTSILGEVIERQVGPPASSQHGHSLDGSMPVTRPDFWKTKEEMERKT